MHGFTPPAPPHVLMSLHFHTSANLLTLCRKAAKLPRLTYGPHTTVWYKYQHTCTHQVTMVPCNLKYRMSVCCSDSNPWVQRIAHPKGGWEWGGGLLRSNPPTQIEIKKYRFYNKEFFVYYTIQPNTTIFHLAVH